MKSGRMEQPRHGGDGPFRLQPLDDQKTGVPRLTSEKPADAAAGGLRLGRHMGAAAGNRLRENIVRQSGGEIGIRKTRDGTEIDIALLDLDRLAVPRVADEREAEFGPRCESIEPG